MTHAQRNEAIRKLIERRTKENTASRQAAREALIEDGIYTKEGKLRAEYGGDPKKGKRAA